MLFLASLDLGRSQAGVGIGSESFVDVVDRQLVDVHFQLLLQVLEAIVPLLLV
jgi:hypothetical protein